MLQCVAVCCSVLQCVAVCCSVLQCVAVCCSVLHGIAGNSIPGHLAFLGMRRRSSPIVCCSVLQCAAVYCSVLRCVFLVWGSSVSGDERTDILCVRLNQN